MAKKNKIKLNSLEYCYAHQWIRGNEENPDRCEMEDKTCKGRLEWSNKNHKYIKNRNDWQRICHSHHIRYDKSLKRR